MVGLAIYAAGLDSDLDDANAKAASPQKQIDEAQNTGTDVIAAAKSAYADLSEQAGAATCERSFLSACSGLRATVQDGVDTAVAELKSLQPQCAEALGQG